MSLALLAAIVLVLALVAAVRPAHAAETAKAPCTAPENRQFDFWIGDWDVRTPDGKLAGTNRVESTLGGCVIQEHWKGASGLVGTSFNAYDPGDRMWHQTWVDDHGTLLLLAGKFEDGRMTLSGETKDAAGTGTAQRITWTPLDGGRVRQLWEQSADGGATWTTAFDGTYTKRKP